MSEINKNKDFDFNDDIVKDTYARDTLQEIQRHEQQNRNDDRYIGVIGDSDEAQSQSRTRHENDNDQSHFRQTDADTPRVNVSDHNDSDGESPVDPFADQEEMRTKPSIITQYITWILSGNILSRAEVRKQYPYICFMALLTFLYITNIFNTQKLYRKQDRLTAQVKELRSKSLTLSSIRMRATRQSAILEQLEQRGIDLKESISPPMIMER